MRDHDQPLPEAQDPGRGLREDSLAPLPSDVPIEESGADAAGGVERQMPDDDAEAPERQALADEDEDGARVRRSEESA